MKVLRAVLVTLMTLAVLTATSYGAGFAVRHYTDVGAGSASAAEPTDTADGTGSPTVPTPSSSPDPAAEPSETPGATPSAEPTPQDVLSPGDRGDEVRELQARLFQLAWLPELTTGRYDATTRAAVAGFQGKRGLEATGVVDTRTWKRLVTMTTSPTHDQLFNVLHPGPAILGAGDTGEAVRDLQARLVATQWLFGDVSGTFDSSTVEAVEGFQTKRGIPVTGGVDQRTLDRLHAMTGTPTHAAMYNLVNQVGALDARCRTGRALCIDKTSHTLRWVVDGQVRQTLDVRFGASYSPTREGLFHVSLKDADHVSNLYGSEMPYSMFFSGGQAVHYSSDFAARGYAGASHGCVNVRDYAGLAHLFDEVGLGDTVVVYWS